MLAYRLGMTVGELLRTTDARELQEWKIWSRFHPIDDARDDARAAIVCRTMANIHRGKGTPPYKTKDFMPEYGREKTKLRESQKFLMLCAARGIKVTRK